jgi:uncharacterized protein (DUF885 family)
MRPYLLAFVLLTSFFRASPQGQGAPSNALDRFFSSFTDEWMLFHTDQAARTAYFTGPRHDAVTRQLNSQTLRWRTEEATLAARGLRTLRALERTGWTETEQISADLMATHLSRIVEGAQFAEYQFPLVQTSGVPSDVVETLAVDHVLSTARDAENYVARLRLVSERVEEALADARALDRKGLLPPRFILQASVRQLEGFIKPAPAANDLVAGFDEKMRRVAMLADGQREHLRREAETIVATRIYPTWRRTIAFLESATARASDEPGLSQRPGGARAYAFFLRQATTTNLSADEIHEIGLNLDAEIDKEMDRVLRQVGYVQGSVRERYDAFLKSLPTFPATDEGVAAYKADIEQTLADARIRTEKLFDRVPKAPVVSQPYPAFFGSRAASYNRPALDGSRPGIFQFSLERGARKYSRSSVYHETMPGHHLQVALGMENPSLPRWRQITAYGGVPAFSEGWALYAEQFVAESGWYEGDPAGLLSQLQRKQFRARRLVRTRAFTSSDGPGSRRSTTWGQRSRPQARPARLTGTS